MTLKQILIISGLLLISLSTSAQRDFNIEKLAEISHGNILTNDVWGYIDDEGVEYGIVGTRSEAIIYNLSDPSNPVEIKRIPGANSVWRDFKSHGKFIYQVADQGQDGLTVIDMTLAPDSISSFLWKGPIELNGNTSTLNRCHNLYIDKGLAYLSGCNVAGGGPLIVDIATDPYNPTVVGAADQRYAHDCIVFDTFLYSSEINQGNLGIYSIADLTNPKLLSRTRTTSSFTHNAWMSDDAKYIFTTDERGNSFVDAYDISDPTAPIRIDAYRPPNKNGAVPHNAHYLNGYLIVSWYSEGVIILDAHRPDNLIRVGQYDTFKSAQTGAEGCWGAYPYFDSGLIIAGDIQAGFFVLQPTFQRAAYLEGSVLDANVMTPINNAQLQILDIDRTAEVSNASGEFKTGTIDTGIVKVIVSHPEYITDTFDVQLESGVVANPVFLLSPKISLVISGTVNSTTGDPIQNAVVKVQTADGEFKVNTDEQGTYSFQAFGGSSKLQVGAWGYKGVEQDLNLNEATTRNITLELGYEDDFFADLGWIVSGDASAGIWERAIPLGTLFNQDQANPSEDVPNDIGNQCYVSGNGSEIVSVDDIDNGTTIIESPLIDLRIYNDPAIQISTWFYNDGGASEINDTMNINAIIDTVTITLASIIYIPGEATTWNELEIPLSDFINEAKTLQIQITASDSEPGHIVEAGFDQFRIVEADRTTATLDLPIIDNLIISPNPSQDFIQINNSKNKTFTRIELTNMSGQSWIFVGDLHKPLNVSNLAAGVYHINAISENERMVSKFIKL